MIKNIFPASALLFLFVLIFYSCKHEPEALPVPSEPSDTLAAGIPCNPDTAYFVNDVLPILISGCAMSGCHDAASASDGVVLTSYASVMNTADIRPGNPGDSDLYERITDDDLDDRMPPPPMAALSPEQIQTIRLWIAQGAKNNYCDNGCDTTAFTFNAGILPLINNNCKGCHSGAQPSGNIRLEDYATIRQAAINGSLYGAVSHQPGFSPMPQNAAKLPDCNISQIRKWIENGTPNN